MKHYIETVSLDTSRYEIHGTTGSLSPAGMTEDDFPSFSQFMSMSFSFKVPQETDIWISNQISDLSLQVLNLI